MPGFVTSQRSTTALPKELPVLNTQVVGHQGIPDGAVYELDGGARFKLRNARWVPVVKRERKDGNAKKKGK
jgi:hypothetical protein